MKETYSETTTEKGDGRRLLRELEATGEYIFHGSPVEDIVELEARQAFDWKGETKSEHGAPAVVGTPYADIAIFRSLIYRDSTEFGSDGGQLHFGATQKALDMAKDDVGYVYVLPRAGFRPLHSDESGMDWRASETQRPVRVVRVAFEDLPGDIRILTE